MATTTTVNNVDTLKGPSGKSNVIIYQVPAYVTGTYLTATKPTFDVLAALQARHEGISAAVVQIVFLMRDYRVGSTVYTAPNAGIVLSGTNNNTVTFEIDSGATDGVTGSEIADTTALDGYFTFGVVCSSVTGG